LFCAGSYTTRAQFYNGSQLTFGKNRVQFIDDFWTFYRFEKFDTYFYTGGKSLAIFTAKYADESIKTVEKKLDYNLGNKIQFIVYNKLGDLKESNIGLVGEEQYNIGGVTHIIGSKVFIYYDGSHENLKKQISAGIAKVVLNELMYGEQITAKIKNSTLMTLPDWFVQGLVSYVSDDWNTDIDNYVKDGILSGNYEKFNQLSGTDAVYAGHSIWKYIADKYGTDKIPNIIYMTKISKSVESGFLFVLGLSFKTFTQDWLDYYDKKYYDYDKTLTLPEESVVFKTKKIGKVYENVKMSPDGKYLAFVTNQIGQYKVWLYDTEKKKLKRLMKAEHKLDEKTDYSFPVMAWHPTSKRLAIITEKKGKIFLYYYNIDEGEFEKLRLFDFQKVLDFSYSQNGKLLAMSGVMNGQTDIFVYNLGAHTYEQITKDIYDDFSPVFINNSSQIVFSSNRDNDTIKLSSKDSITVPNTKQDLFIYNYSLKSKVLRRITETTEADETQPIDLENNYISYLSDANGIVNRYVAKLDSAISFIDTTTHYRFFSTEYPQTNFSRNIMDYDISVKQQKCSEVFYKNGLYGIYMEDISEPEKSSVQLKNTPYINELQKYAVPVIKNTSGYISTDTAIKKDTTEVKHKHIVSVSASDTVGSNKIDINNYEFDVNTKQNIVAEEKPDTTAKKEDTAKSVTKKTKPDLVLPRQQNYDVEYSIDQLVNQIDFSYLNNTYQPFSGVGQPIFLNPGFNALFKVGVTDLLEDYRVTGGVRFSVDLDNTEYLLSFENLRQRLDRQLLYHRQTLQNVQDYSVIKTSSNQLLYVLKYPFSQVLAVKTTALVRNDRDVFLSTDLHNLQEPNVYKTWGGLKGELIFDNTREKGLNLYYGTRWKIFAEAYKRIDVKNKMLYVVGFDYRNYQKISRTFIWANRFAASTSFGTQKLVYYMGGVDNWVLPRPSFDSTITVATDQNYAYQTLATPMRGFIQNIRNGNSFALLNSEFRFPIFRYLINRPLKSDFFNNFQLVAFTDVGTAWTGSNPYSDKNALYTETIHQGPITVTITTQKEPIVAGYGFGLRTRLLGYFVRADWAWGVEDGVLKKGVFYLSLNLDF
jgi:Tol biopolymer transport system component